MNRQSFAKLKLNKESIRFARCFVDTEVRIYSDDLFSKTSGLLLYADKDGFLILQDGRYTLTTAILIPLSGFVFSIPAAFLARILVRLDVKNLNAENRSFAITQIISDDRDRFKVALYDGTETLVAFNEQINPAFEEMVHYVPEMEIVEE
jgi:hypothetical protein